jgi:hypothetical protein
MENNQLREKYNTLLAEYERISKENTLLKQQLGIQVSATPDNGHTEMDSAHSQHADGNATVNKITKNADSTEKIQLFMSLFKGRDDVYAKRWTSNKTEKSGYSPVCINIWKTGLCSKPKGACTKCKNKLYAELDSNIIEQHLRGNSVVGIYPMLSDETCYFPAIDFDGGDWKKDVSALRNVCDEFKIPVAVERSRSGKGGHVWFFFEDKISAVLARKPGSGLLTYAMNQRREINFYIL